MNPPKEHFWALVLRLLGEKDRTKVCEAVAKVERAMGTGDPWSGSSHRGRSSDILYKGRGMRSSASVQCFFVERSATLWRGVTRGGICSKGPRQPVVALGTISNKDSGIK